MFVLAFAGGVVVTIGAAWALWKYALPWLSKYLGKEVG
jgi:hypothetical protein